ncbi:NTP-binding protein [Escherichia coli]
MVQITSDIELSGAGCTTAITPNQLFTSNINYCYQIWKKG